MLRATDFSVKLDALKKISVAAFHILIGLTKVPKIELLQIGYTILLE